MKILIYEWNGLAQKDLRNSLMMLGHEVDRIGYVVREKCEDLFFEEMLLKRLKKGYDLAISYNFYPSVAKCCKETQTPYFSWIYDGEDMGLYHKNAFFDTNYIFSFDRALLKRMKAKGIMNAWYLPLGVNTRRLNAIPYSREDEARFGSEVSFIGNLYQNKGSLDSIPHSDYLRGYLEGIIKAQLKINFNSLLDELLTPELVEKIMEENYPEVDGRYIMQPRESIRNSLAVSVTQRERFFLMQELSKHYLVDLYTYSQTENLPNVRKKGVAGYYSEMPRIFRYSKINLNITHRMIMTGIPLRVTDVLGAGGFLITNYQSDMEGVFRDGEHLAVYYSTEDLVEKIGFYLKNEAERKKIAKNGHQLVCEKYATEKLLPEMFRLAGIF